MITALLITWLIVVSIQLFYILFVFFRTALFRQSGLPPTHSELPITLIVCAHNERENLTELLPLLNAQAYSAFEVRVMSMLAVPAAVL